MKIRGLLCLASALLSLAAIAQKPATKQTAPFFSRNLVKNGNAASEEVAGHVQGWVSDVLNTSTYGHTSGEWDWDVQGAPNGGCCYFRLSWDGEDATKSATQTIDLAPGAADIDRGDVNAKISAYLGALVDSNTSGSLNVTWLDASGAELGTLSTDVVKPSDLPKPKIGSASLVAREKSALVPKGARKAVVKLTAQANNDPSGQYIFLADNISLVLEQPQK